MHNTPNSTRLQVAIFGRRNSGKSTLFNAITSQEASIVSAEAGTTTDSVVRSMELHGVGAVLFIDTPGFDDVGELGRQRVDRAEMARLRCDVAILLCDDGDLTEELKWAKELKSRGVPIITMLSKADQRVDCESITKHITEKLGVVPIVVSGVDNFDIEPLRQAILSAMPEGFTSQTILGDMVQKGDLVLLVMPQDPQAPKGRLILPQVQTLRELLDRECSVVSCTGDAMQHTLDMLKCPPTLVITDSQIFKRVYELLPEGSRLTSFSLLMAGYKGDIQSFISGAEAIDRLSDSSRVLIAEACTHAPMSEDIGREKLPRMLRQRVGESLAVDVVAGRNFPDDLTPYDLVIHCGGCMFNRKYMLSRIEQAKAQGVPITNYGVAIAHISGILDKVCTK